MFIELTTSDGHKLKAWKAGPDTATKALVIVQEIFGVNNHMRHVCDVYAKQGYAVISPALFDRAERDVELGYEQADIQRGLALRAKIAPEQTMADIEAAAAALPKGAKKGIIGYCWGGTVAWWGATRSQSFKAANAWYGGGIAVAKDEKPNCPVQMHFGETDASIPMKDVEAIRAAQPGVEIFVYDGAGHGFGCEERGSYKPVDAELALKRSLEFFGRTLG